MTCWQFHLINRLSGVRWACLLVRSGCPSEDPPIGWTRMQTAWLCSEAVFQRFSWEFTWICTPGSWTSRAM